MVGTAESRNYLSAVCSACSQVGLSAPKAVARKRGWEVLLENCTAVVPTHGFWMNIFSGGSYSVMMGSESITSVVQSEIRPDGFAPVTQLQLLQEERNTGYKSK